MPQRGHELKLVRVYQDILSGLNKRRPGLQDALTQPDKRGAVPDRSNQAW